MVLHRVEGEIAKSRVKIFCLCVLSVVLLASITGCGSQVSQAQKVRNETMDQFSVALAEYESSYTAYKDSIDAYNEKLDKYIDAGKDLEEAIASANELIDTGIPYDESLREGLKKTVSEASVLLGSTPEKKHADVETLFTVDDGMETEAINKVIADVGDANGAIKQKTAEIATEANSIGIPDYSDEIQAITDGMEALSESIKKNEELTNPDEEWVMDRLGTVPEITEIIALTEDTDSNNLLHKRNGYTAAISFATSYFDPSDYTGVDRGGTIEVFADRELADNRLQYLSTFDSITMFDVGTHIVLGTMVIRLSDVLKASEQNELEAKIVDAFLDSEISVSDNSISGNSVSGNSVSGNSGSDNSVSDNSVSDNSVSDNTVSENEAIDTRPEREGLGENKVVKIGIYEFQVPSYWDVDREEEDYYRAYAETNGKVAMLNVEKIYDDQDPVSFEILEKETESGEMADAILSWDMGAEEIESSEVFETDEIKGIIYTFSFVSEGIPGKAKVLYFPSVDDNSWYLPMIGFTDNTEYQYNDGFDRIIASFKKAEQSKEDDREDNKESVGTVETGQKNSNSSTASSSTGAVSNAGEPKEPVVEDTTPVYTQTYVLNKNTKKIHYPSCSSVAKIKPKNYAESNKSVSELMAQGYSPCGICKPR